MVRLSQSDFFLQTQACCFRHFVRSGDVAISNGRLWGASIDGFYRSRNAKAYSSPVGVDTATACYLHFNAGAVYPSVDYDRWLGLPLRCLAL